MREHDSPCNSRFLGRWAFKQRYESLVNRILSSGAVYLSLLDSIAVISKPKVSISIKNSNTVTRHHLPSGRLADRPYSPFHCHAPEMACFLLFYRAMSCTKPLTLNLLLAKLFFIVYTCKANLLEELSNES